MRASRARTPVDVDGLGAISAAACERLMRPTARDWLEVVQQRQQKQQQREGVRIRVSWRGDLVNSAQQRHAPATAVAAQHGLHIYTACRDPNNAGLHAGKRFAAAACGPPSRAPVRAPTVARPGPCGKW